ncbi:SRPBCC family protein [Streptomyces sp. NPDC086783]|uniref:SRPBCC family protein n=1 Tax=Streptomyces sp. NPDC086783 TaxID=3365758 RepID=UPI003804AD3E
MPKHAGNGYEFAATVTVSATMPLVLEWLTAPEKMPKWVLGLKMVETEALVEHGLTAYVRLDFGQGNKSPGTFCGEVLRVNEQTVEKHYWKAGSFDSYERSIRYDLRALDGATEVTCHVRTVIAGLGRGVSEIAAQVELSSLRRSLNRLRAQIEGQHENFFKRFRDGSQSCQPL